MKRFISLLFFAPVFLFAVPPVGTITGSGSTVNGKALQTSGAPNWPVGAGDEIVAGPSGATVTLPDGSGLVLSAGTRVKFKSCGVCVTQLFSGSIAYSKAAGSNFEICALGHPVRPQAGDGSVIVESTDTAVHQVGTSVTRVVGANCACNASAAWKNASHLSKAKVAAITAAGGGGAAAGIAVVRSSKRDAENGYNPPGQSKK